MARTRSYRIRVRKRKIKQRQEKMLAHHWYYPEHSCRHYQKVHDILSNKQSGYLSNNYYWSIGGAKKTKTKNTRVARHVKGNYGKSICYSRHDKVQILYMNQALKEYYNNEGDEIYDYTN